MVETERHAFAYVSQHTEPQSLREAQRCGARTVRIGGLALALGGIFLARYAIEAGVIGPIALGALLALCLVAAGEWTRRQEALVSYVRVPSVHIPGILTAAGTTVAYATVYAAYGVYGFLSPAAAFVLLGLVALMRPRAE